MSIVSFLICHLDTHKYLIVCGFLSLCVAMMVLFLVSAAIISNSSSHGNLTTGISSPDVFFFFYSKLFKNKTTRNLYPQNWNAWNWKVSHFEIRRCFRLPIKVNFWHILSSLNPFCWILWLFLLRTSLQISCGESYLTQLSFFLFVQSLQRLRAHMS